DRSVRRRGRFDEALDARLVDDVECGLECVVDDVGEPLDPARAERQAVPGAREPARDRSADARARAGDDDVFHGRSRRDRRAGRAAGQEPVIVRSAMRTSTSAQMTNTKMRTTPWPRRVLQRLATKDPAPQPKASHSAGPQATMPALWK